DTRDFQLACRDPIACAHQLPIPYLRRYVHEIPSDKQVVIVASDYEGKNIGARFLKQKGINVIGYLMRKELRKERPSCNMNQMLRTVLNVLKDKSEGL